MFKLILLLFVALGILAVVYADPAADARSLQFAVPDPAARARLTACAQSISRSITTSVIARLPPSLRPALHTYRSRCWSLALRLAALAQVAPMMIPLLVAAVTLGLARREAASRGAAWSSSTLARLAVYLALVAIILVAMYLLSSLPYAFVYLPCALLVLSVYLYLANLPSKL